MPPLANIQPSANELKLIQDIEEEFFLTRCPEVEVIPVTRPTHENLQIEVGESEGTPVVVNANWDWNSRIRELIDGVWQNTRKLEVQFLRRQIEENNIPLEEGNLINLNPEGSEKYKILRLKGKSSTIKRTTTKLHIVAVVDLSQGWE